MEHEAVAHLADCCELHVLSGWGDEGGVSAIPFYTAHSLMSMLPPFILEKRGNGNFRAEWRDYTPGGRVIEAESRTNAANALCRLAIALFQAGVLLRNTGKGAQ